MLSFVLPLKSLQLALTATLCGRWHATLQQARESAPIAKDGDGHSILRFRVVKSACFYATLHSRQRTAAVPRDPQQPRTALGGPTHLLLR